jgi:phosphoglycerate dehydrogenase-like enzyme
VTAADLVHVLVTYHGFDPSRVVPQVEAVDPRVRASVCLYDNDHDVRVERELHPFDAATRAKVPAPDDAQRAAFARANIGLCLDVPLDLREVAPRLKWVQNVGSGVGQYVSSRLPEAGIVLTNAAGLSAPGIAEFVMARVLEHWKLLPDFVEMQATRTWAFHWGRRVEGSTMTVIGLGSIGAAVARLARAFGMRVIATRRQWSPGASDDRVDELLPATELHAAVARADVVVLCATGTGANDGLIGAAEFAAMRPGALFVNVARGNLVDETALVDALTSGHLGAAAIDVTRQEPLPADSPLWSVPRLRLSPHSSSTQDGYLDRVAGLFCENLAAFLAGRPLRNVVELERGY